MTRLMVLLLIAIVNSAGSTKLRGEQSDPLIVVTNGVLTYYESGEEATFFGVNYSPAFAHSYRALNVMGKDHKEAIREDVYHFARLGFNAYRIHMWDTEITDSLGNLIDNVHLELHNYTLYELRKRGIKTILTPLTFYDNAYPDGATPTPGFANYISKAEAPVNRDFWPIIKRYLQQLINHINPYTGLSPNEDPNIIAIEIVNEPIHGADNDLTTEYINLLAGHLRAHGWTKPIFYNLSESPVAAEGVLASNIDGVSFQWYPAGLVGGATIEKNYMPYVYTYPIPWSEDERFQTKALMVYEFDAADVMNSYAYPLMARSFREAGFQWATQFAYDPLAFAHVNSDYPTHYLNMIYTPSKAISMLIASEIFRRVSRFERFGNFPADTLFGEFRVSHHYDLSEMNSEEIFLYSNNTKSVPVTPARLKRIAGVGSSSVVAYDGRGAYFLDKLDDGVWRLEVMPDAIPIRDPFERPAFHKIVTHIEWRHHPMTIELPDLGPRFHIQALNDGNNYSTSTSNGTFHIAPGSYLLIRDGVTNKVWGPQSKLGNIRLKEFVAVPSTVTEPALRHVPHELVEAGEPFVITADIVGLGPSDTVWLYSAPAWGESRRIVMTETAPFRYEAEIHGDLVRPGVMNYWIVIESERGMVTFPGNNPGAPWHWNYYFPEQWSTHVFEAGAPIDLFNAVRDYETLQFGFPFWRTEGYVAMTSSGTPGKMGIRVGSNIPTTERHVVGWGFPVRHKIKGIRPLSLTQYKYLAVRARAAYEDGTTLHVIVVDGNGHSFSSVIELTGTYQNYAIPFHTFKSDSFMLLPRSYPQFMAPWFNSESSYPPSPHMIEEIQFYIDVDLSAHPDRRWYGFEIESIWLK